MAAQSLQSFPPTTLGQQSKEVDWVALRSRTNAHSRSDPQPGMFQNKLLFNEAFPASASNRATHVAPPAPIVIERLLPLSEHCDNVDSTKSSFSFTTLSEERLQAAVKLAKRDLRRRRLKSLTKSATDPSPQASFFETSDAELLEELKATPSKAKLKSSSPKEKAVWPKTKVLHTSQKRHMPRTGQSPPTRDLGPKQPERGQQVPLSQEICRLQNKLEVYIQKVEELASRGVKMEEPLDPEEQNKLELRKKKQAARTARFIYVLQQQVKEIQDDLEKLHRQKMCDNKKATTIHRLAAAHRGTLRALQVVIHQLSDLSHSKVPPHYKELCQLIRQLSLCSAKMEVEQGSATPVSVLNILQKLETLDSALTKQETVEKMQAQTCPPHRRYPCPSMSPDSTPKGASNLTTKGASKSSNPRRIVFGSRRAPHKPKTMSYHPVNKREVQRTSLKGLVQQRELREHQGRSQTKALCQKGQQFGGTKADVITERNQMQNTGFQQPTVSSRLRVNQLPQKEQSVPWMPTSPHSPPPQRSPQRERSEPRCLFSSVKFSESPPKQKGGVEAELALSSEKKKQSQNESIRKAWLDRMTTQRLKDLNQLSKEETERIQKLRSEVVSPSPLVKKAEQKVRDRIQPLLDEVEVYQIGKTRNRINPFLKSRLSKPAAERATESAEEHDEALLEDLLEDTAEVVWKAKTDRQLEDITHCRLQAPTLEGMLLRMDEIQRDQEEVRRRFASITYSDPLYWDRPEMAVPQSYTSGLRPASPQPIRLTRPVMKQTSAADIVLKNPVETGLLSENSLTEEASQEEQQPRISAMFPGVAERSSGTPISVPGSMLKSIRRYREDYEAYLRVVAHEAVGTFNPWAIAESLADDLLSEAVADVAAEFQEVVEEYAEAVFTSEFVQPLQSDPNSAAAVVIQ